MGNQLCSSEQSHKYQFKRQSLQEITTSDHKLQKKDNLFINKPALTDLHSPKIQTSFPKQFNNLKSPLISQLKYKDYLIKFKKSDIDFYQLQSGQQKIPILNGLVKVYKLTSNDFDQQYELLYEGQMKKSKFNGYGKMYHNNELIYEGEFKNDRYDGWGITNNYEGEFREGKFDGFGIYRQYEDPIKKDHVNFYYQGYFQNGMYTGSGVQIKGGRFPVDQLKKIHSSSGILEYLNLQIQHNLDMLRKYKVSDIYIGQFSNGYCHGFGRHITENQQFSGQFSYNMYHGLGTIYNNSQKGKKVIQAVFKMGKQANK